jgi:hypothetical protein
MDTGAKKEVPMRYRRAVILSSLLATILFATPMLAHGKAKGKGGGVPPGSAEVGGHPAAFLPEERQLIVTYFQRSPSGLPPGLAKRGGQLPPGLQKHLQRNGTLPPGLQKRLQPLPTTLEIQLPSLPDIWGRVILGPHVLLIDRRTSQILDVLENVLTAQ